MEMLKCICYDGHMNILMTLVLLRLRLEVWVWEKVIIHLNIMIQIIM